MNKKLLGVETCVSLALRETPRKPSKTNSEFGRLQALIKKRFDNFEQFLGDASYKFSRH